MDISTAPRIETLERVPDGLLTVAATDLHRVLGGPTLIHLPGKRPEPLFVAVLLHGNETTGLRAMQEVLRRYAGRLLPRALSLFVGNIAAARHNVRRLEREPDYNRVWPGTEQPDHPLHAMMASVVDEMRGRRVFASVDIHNNTGLNPHYACVNRLAAPFLHLARLFSRTVVHFERPVGVQSAAFASLCPAVTVECGKSGILENADHAAEFVDACMHLSHFPDHPVPKHDLDLYHTVATVNVPEGIDFCIGTGDCELRFNDDLETLNFRDLAAGWPLARVRGPGLKLTVSDHHGRDVSAFFLGVKGDVLELKRAVTPAMLTQDARVIRQDCLCYFMERLAYQP
ncbi:MAG: M14 family metallopeptidase [Burkholderiales bacterium]|jgi:succinylglutamate desuccinylase|nr:M14 family metallopeptidase [Burkholderiales bacterium]